MLRTDFMLDQHKIRLSFFFSSSARAMEQYVQLCDYLATVGKATIPGQVNDVVLSLTSLIGASEDQVRSMKMALTAL